MSIDSAQFREMAADIKKGTKLYTPDNAMGVSFTFVGLDDEMVKITLNGGEPMCIPIDAFVKGYNYLNNKGHDVLKPIEIRANNDPDLCGPLCTATRELNDDVRCITYILPILKHLGLVDYDGDQPNTAWYV